MCRHLKNWYATTGCSPLFLCIFLYMLKVLTHKMPQSTKYIIDVGLALCRCSYIVTVMLPRAHSGEITVPVLRRYMYRVLVYALKSHNQVGAWPCWKLNVNFSNVFFGDIKIRWIKITVELVKNDVGKIVILEEWNQCKCFVCLVTLTLLLYWSG